MVKVLVLKLLSGRTSKLAYKLWTWTVTLCLVMVALLMNISCVIDGYRDQSVRHIRNHVKDARQFAAGINGSAKSGLPAHALSVYLLASRPYTLAGNSLL